MRRSASNTPSLSPAWSAVIQRFPTHSSNSVGGWVWIYNTAATIGHGVKSATDANVLKEKLSLNWTGPFKIIAVDPSPFDSTTDGRPLVATLLHLDFPSDIPGLDAHCRVSVAHCKPCANPHDTTDLPDISPLD